ncbi:Armadillo-like helical domain containing protein [Gracilaria domingensis]|nr:Armadillo-like helical domain containing protein [Gracilaria domingensis]
MYRVSFVSRTCICQRHCSQAFPRTWFSSLQQRSPSAVRLAQCRIRAHLHSPEPDYLLQDLCSGSQPRQLVALVRLTSIPPNEALGILEKSETLASNNKQVRLSALATLGKLGFRERAGVLVNALESDGDHAVRAAAANGLGNLLHPNEGEGSVKGYENVLHALIRAAQKKDEHFIVRYAALVALGELANPSAVDIVLPIVRDLAAPALEVMAAVAAIGKMMNAGALTAEVLEAVKARAADRDELIRAAVVRTLGRWLGVHSVPELLQRMNKDEQRYGQSKHVHEILDDVLRNGSA